jgi:hypothetical protein
MGGGFFTAEKEKILGIAGSGQINGRFQACRGG